MYIQNVQLRWGPTYTTNCDEYARTVLLLCGCNSVPSLPTSRVRWRETCLFPVVFLKDRCSVDDVCVPFFLWQATKEEGTENE